MKSLMDMFKTTHNDKSGSELEFEPNQFPPSSFQSCVKMNHYQYVADGARPAKMIGYYTQGVADCIVGFLTSKESKTSKRGATAFFHFSRFSDPTHLIQFIQEDFSGHEHLTLTLIGASPCADAFLPSNFKEKKELHIENSSEDYNRHMVCQVDDLHAQNQKQDSRSSFRQELKDAEIKNPESCSLSQQAMTESQLVIYDYSKIDAALKKGIFVAGHFEKIKSDSAMTELKAQEIYEYSYKTMPLQPSTENNTGSARISFKVTSIKDSCSYQNLMRLMFALDQSPLKMSIQHFNCVSLKPVDIYARFDGSFGAIALLDLLLDSALINRGIDCSRFMPIKKIQSFKTIPPMLSLNNQNILPNLCIQSTSKKISSPTKNDKKQRLTNPNITKVSPSDSIPSMTTATANVGLFGCTKRKRAIEPSQPKNSFLDTDTCQIF